MNKPFLTFDSFELHGPIHYDEAVWQEAKIPPDYPVAYVQTYRPDVQDAGEVYWRGYDGMCGVARRLQGLVRPMLDEEPWEEPFGWAPEPWVHAPVELAPEEALCLLAPYLSGLRIELHDRVTHEYRLDADGAIMWCDPCRPTIHPWVRTQSWFTSPDATTEYQFNSNPETDAPAQVAVAVRELAAVTGGVILDEDGYPWPA